MARILSIATEVPRHTLSASKAESLLRTLLSNWGRPHDSYVRILHNTGIESRHVAYGGDAVLEERTLGERNSHYARTSVELAEAVVRQALHDAHLEPQAVDCLISVSCTGFMLPSVDAYLINALQMNPQVRRIPITELGCAAGAAGLARAWEQLQVYRGSRVLLLSVELPSLTFQPRDQRLSQLISSMIFADGAAAVVLGDEGATAGPTLLGSRTYTIPGTLGEMGYNLDEHGFHIVLSANVPNYIRDTLRPQIACLLEQHGASLSDLRWCAMHPAGPKVLKLVAEELNFTLQQLAPSWKVLKDFGNMSSASVLFVLAEMMRHPTARPGDLGVIVAFGPGLSGEIVLARWES